uniref:SH3 domain-containing protein n=1 Tax=Stegastes partitus TaxID=144197 RepID=A0A3B5BIL2_9TELE
MLSSLSEVNLWFRRFVCFARVLNFRYKAVYNYKPQNSDELELREGDIVQVMEKCDDGWFVGKEFCFVILFKDDQKVLFSVYTSLVVKKARQQLHSKWLNDCFKYPKLILYLPKLTLNDMPLLKSSRS